MSESWKKWEGRSVDGFSLQNYLGASDRGAVFLTAVADSEKAAIKLTSAEGADADEQLRQWRSAAELTHPNLIRILAFGRGELDGVPLIYVVQEYAEENLAQILPERALTAEEARGMLPPVLEALQFVHDKGYVHGHIQPSNILAIGDQVKLSSDGLIAQGEHKRSVSSANNSPEAMSGNYSPASDVRQLGVTMVEVLTQRPPSGSQVPASVPEPFHEIAINCLQADPEKRWSLTQIGDRLNGKTVATASASGVQRETIASATNGSQAAIMPRPKVSAKWGYLLLVAAVAAIVFILIPKPKPPNSTESVQSQSQEVQPAKPTQVAPSEGEDKGKPAQPAATPEQPSTLATSTSNTTNASTDGVVQRVLPEISPSARRTIQGKIKVRIKVDVDAAGNVESAKFESAGSSKFFARSAMEAAKQWKFSPAAPGESSPRQWKLQFAFSRAKTEASATRGKH